MKNYTLLFLLILNVGLLSGQCRKNDKCHKTDSSAIVLNPFGENQIPKCICYGAWVKYKINNVNNLLVNGVSESNSETMDFETPEMITNALKKADSVNKSNDGNETFVLQSNDKGDFISELKLFVQHYRKIEDYTNLEGQLIDLLNDHLFIEDKEAFKDHGSYIFQSIFDLEGSIDAYGQLSATLEALDAAFFELKKLYEDINAVKEIGTMSVSMKFKNGEKENIENISIVDMNKPKFKAEYDFAKKTYEELHKKENKEKLENKVNAGIRLYQKIKDAGYTIHGDAGQATGDVFTTKITLKNAKGDTLHTYNPITLRTRGGIKVNFSSGYLLSFRGNESYSSFRENDSSPTSIKADNKDKLTHALGALVHVYPRDFRDIQPGISAGLSVEDDADLGFYLGLSALFTESNRFVLTAGVSMTKVDKLNTANLSDATNGIKTFISEDNTNINYDKVYRPAFFIGFTYNLSNAKSNND